MQKLYADISSNLPVKPLRRFFRLVAGERDTVIKIYLYAIVAGLIGLSLPLGIQAIINLVATGTLTTSWGVLVGVVLAGVLVGGLMQILQLTLSEALQQRIFVKSALELSFRIPRLDSLALRNHYIPELANRFFDTLTVQKGLTKILLDFSASSLQIIFGLLLLSFYHPLFIIFGGSLIISISLLIRFSGPAGLRTSLKESSYKYEVAHWLEEIGRRKDLFKGTMPEKMSMKNTDKLAEKYLTARKGHFSILMVKYGFLLLFKLLIIGGLLAIGSLLVVENELNLGQFVASEIIIILLISSLEKLVLSIETIYDVLTGLEKLGYITDLPLEQRITEEMNVTQKKMDVKFEDFVLQFPGSTRPDLSCMSLDIRGGERILITGGDRQIRYATSRSIAGDFHHFSGKLSIAGIPIRNWNKDTLRQYLGIYNSSEELFDGTLLDNVTLLSGKMPMNEIAYCAEVIGLDEFIDHDAEGWYKKAGPDGIWLPESVKPKLVLCRLMLVKPRIFLLSGIFSAIEPKACNAFWNYLDTENPDATVIAMEENSTIPGKFDKILQFKTGEICSHVSSNN